MFMQQHTAAAPAAAETASENSTRTVDSTIREAYTNNADDATPSENLCFVCFEANAPRSQCACVDSHVHDECLERWLQQSGQQTCSVCRSPYANVETERVTVHCRLNESVWVALFIWFSTIVLSVCGIYGIVAYFSSGELIPLVAGLAFLLLIPPTLWWSRRPAHRARLDGWKLKTRVTRAHPKVVVRHRAEATPTACAPAALDAC